MSEVEVKDADDSSRASISRLMNKKVSLENDGGLPTRLSTTVKIDEDDLDKEIAARMQAFSSGYKPSTGSSYSFLNDPLTHSSSSSYSKTSPSSKNVSSAYYSSGSSPYMTESGANTVKSIFESRIRDLESDLENERQARMKSDKQRVDLQKDLGEAKDKLDESQQNLNKQADLNRRREHQLQNISKTLEESQVLAETQMSAFKKKHQETVGQLMDQVDELHKSKQRSEKEKLAVQGEVEGLRSTLEETKNSKALLEKQVKGLDDQLRELNLTIHTMEKEYTDLQGQKSKYVSDVGDLKKRNLDLEKRLQDASLGGNNACKEKKELELLLKEKEEQLHSSQEEAKVFKEEAKSLKEEAEDNKERQDELQKRLTKAMTDVTVWQQKFQENETFIRPEEVEELKKKFIQKLQESEAKVDATIGKMVALEKTRTQAQAQNSGLRDEIERLQNELTLNEKKHKQHDKVVEEWKLKLEDMQKQMEDVNGEARTGSERTLKVNQQLEDANEVIERLRRENKNLHVELDDLNQQLQYANQKAADFDKVAKKAEAEKQELNLAFNGKDLAFQKESAKIQRLQLELATGKEDLDRRMADKEGEIEALRKSHAQSLANLALSMEGESKSKLEALKTTKELEQTISDLELEIVNYNKAFQENDKIHKKYQLQLADLQALLEDEEQLRKKAEDELANHLGKSDALKDEVDVLRLQVESLERNRKMLETEVKEGSAKILELNTSCNSLSEAKKKLESTFNLCKSDSEDQQLTMRRMEDALKKSTIEYNVLNDELKREQAKAAESDKLRRYHEQQAKDLSARLESSDQLSVAGGKSAWNRLEQRVSEQEAELESERSKTMDREKGQRKLERKLQEMDIHLAEQQNLQLKLGDLCEKMQFKIRAYKKNLDDAEQLSEVNLAKFRKLQSDLEEAEARAGVAEKLVEQLRSRAISSVTGEDIDNSRIRKVKIVEE